MQQRHGLLASCRTPPAAVAPNSQPPHQPHPAGHLLPACSPYSAAPPQPVDWAAASGYLESELAAARAAVAALDALYPRVTSFKEVSLTLLEEAHRALVRLEQVRQGPGVNQTCLLLLQRSGSGSSGTAPAAAGRVKPPARSRPSSNRSNSANCDHCSSRAHQQCQSEDGRGPSSPGSASGLLTAHTCPSSRACCCPLQAYHPAQHHSSCGGRFAC